MYRVFLLAAFLAACGGASANRTPAGETGVRALFDAEIRATRSQDWRALYDLGSDRAHSVCSYGDFVTSAGEASVALKELGASWGDLSMKDVRVVVDGHTAKITSTLTANGVDLHVTDDSDPDTAVYEHGHWADDNKGHKGCD